MKVAVLGYGTVGSGVVEVLETNREHITKKAKTPIQVKYILDIRDFEDHPLQHCFTKSIGCILEDDEVKLIVEAMGGINPAYGYIKEALKKGKSVATSNKELVVTHGPELLEIAKKHRVHFLFEASVGGGIPLIRPLNDALTADKITEITGILNGTTNFILTKMAREKRDFAEVLKEAQALGYAERNPEADVEGHDTCRKIAILASLAFGEHVKDQHIATKGITQITLKDIEDANRLDCCIKLLGTCKKEEEKIYATVEPVMLTKNHPLATVDDVFNAVCLTGNMVGEVMFYGKGAGKLPTASAIVADLIDVARHKDYEQQVEWHREEVELANQEERISSYYVRTKGDTMYIETFVQELFGEVEVVKTDEAMTYTFITPFSREQTTKEKLRTLEQLDSCEIVSQIRVER